MVRISWWEGGSGEGVYGTRGRGGGTKTCDKGSDRTGCKIRDGFI